MVLLLASTARPSVVFCKLSSPTGPRSSIIILNPPAVPNPSTGGGPNKLTIATGISLRHRWVIFALIYSLVRPFLIRSSNGFRMMLTEPKFGAFAPINKDCPAIPTVWSTPSVSSAILQMFCIALAVLWTDAASINCTFANRYPLSCGGMNPVGVILK